MFVISTNKSNRLICLKYLLCFLLLFLVFFPKNSLAAEEDEEEQAINPIQVYAEELRVIQQAANQYYRDNSRWPISFRDLTGYINLPGFDGLSPWGEPYRFFSGDDGSLWVDVNPPDPEKIQDAFVIDSGNVDPLSDAEKTILQQSRDKLIFSAGRTSLVRSSSKKSESAGRQPFSGFRLPRDFVVRRLTVTNDENYRAGAMIGRRPIGGPSDYINIDVTDDKVNFSTDRAAIEFDKQGRFDEGVYADRYYSTDNSEFYLDPGQQSRFNITRSSRYYGSSSDKYYLDLQSESNLNIVDIGTLMTDNINTLNINAETINSEPVITQKNISEFAVTSIEGGKNIKVSARVGLVKISTVDSPNFDNVTINQTIKSNSVISKNSSFNNVVATDIKTSGLIANQSTISSINSTDIQTNSLKTNSINTDLLTANSASVKNLVVTENLNADSINANLANIANINATNINSSNLTVSNQATFNNLTVKSTMTFGPNSTAIFQGGLIVGTDANAQIDSYGGSFPVGSGTLLVNNDLGVAGNLYLDGTFTLGSQATNNLFISSSNAETKFQTPGSFQILTNNQNSGLEISMTSTKIDLKTNTANLFLGGQNQTLFKNKLNDTSGFVFSSNNSDVLIIDTQNNSIGINKQPGSGYALDVTGNIRAPTLVVDTINIKQMPIQSDEDILILADTDKSGSVEDNTIQMKVGDQYALYAAYESANNKDVVNVSIGSSNNSKLFSVGNDFSVDKQGLLQTNSLNILEKSTLLGFTVIGDSSTDSLTIKSALAANSTLYFGTSGYLNYDQPNRQFLLGPNLNVAQRISANNLVIYQNATAQNIAISGLTSLKDLVSLGMSSFENLKVEGDLNITGSLNVTGQSTFLQSLYVSSDMVVNSDLFAQNASVNTLIVSNMATINFLNISHNLTVNDGIEVEKASSFYGDVYVSKDFIVGGDVSISGTTTLNDLIVQGNATFEGVVAFTGAKLEFDSLKTTYLEVLNFSTINQLLVQNDSTIEGKLNVKGNAVFANSVEVSQDVSIGGGLYVADASTLGDLYVNEKLVVSELISLGGNLIVNGVSSFYGKTNFIGGASFDTIGATTLIVSDSATIENLSVGNQTTFKDQVFFGKSVSVLGDVFIKNGLVDAKNLYIQNDATINGSIAIGGNASIGSLDVISDSTIKGDLIVGGNSTQSLLQFQIANGASMILTGDASIGGNFTVGKRVSLGGDLLIVGGSLTVNQGLNISNLTSIGGDLIAQGQATLGSLKVGGQVTIGAGLEVGGDTTIDGGLYVNGKDTTSIFKEWVFFEKGVSTKSTAEFANLKVTNIATINNLVIADYNSIQPSGFQVNGSVTFNGGIYIGQGANIGGNLLVSGLSSLEKIIVSAFSTFEDSLIVQGDLTVNNIYATTINSTDLIVARLSSLNKLNVDGKSTFNNDVDISGALSVSSLEVSGKASFNDLIVNNNITINNNLVVTNNASIDGTFIVGGLSTFNNFVYFAAGVQLPENSSIEVNILTVNNVATINSLYLGNPQYTTTTLVVNGQSSLGGGLKVLNGATIDGGLKVTGLSSLNNLYVSGDVTIVGDVSINGDIFVNTLEVSQIKAASLDISGRASINTLVVSSDSTFKGNVDILGNLSVGSFESGGNSTLNNLYVYGPSTFYDGLVVTGDVSINRGVKVGSNATFYELVDFQQDINVASTVSAKRLTISDAATINKLVIKTQSTDQNAPTGLEIVGFTSLYGGLIVSNGVTINSGGLRVTGSSTFEDVYISGGITINNDLVITGLASLNEVKASTVIADAINITKSISVQSLIVSGLTTFANNVLIQGKLSVAEILVSGKAIFNDFVTQGKTTIEGKLFVANDVTIDGSLYVSGATTFNSHVYFNDGFTGSQKNLIVKTLDVKRQATINSLVIGVDGSNDVGLYVQNLTSLEGGLSIQESATIRGGLTVTGLTSLDRLQVDNESTINGRLFVSGLSSLTDLVVTGNSTFQTLYATTINTVDLIATNITITEIMRFVNDVTFDGHLVVNGRASFNGLLLANNITANQVNATTIKADYLFAKYIRATTLVGNEALIDKITASTINTEFISAKKASIYSLSVNVLQVHPNSKIVIGADASISGLVHASSLQTVGAATFGGNMYVGKNLLVAGEISATSAYFDNFIVQSEISLDHLTVNSLFTDSIVVNQLFANTATTIYSQAIVAKNYYLDNLKVANLSIDNFIFPDEITFQKLTVNNGLYVDQLYAGALEEDITLNFTSTIVGNLYVYGVVKARRFETYSDSRFKTNINQLVNLDSPEDTTEFMHKLHQIQAVTYTFNNLFKSLHNSNDNSKQTGFIAQQMAEIAPELVSQDQQGYYSVNYSQFTAYLLEGIKILDQKTKRITDNLIIDQQGIFINKPLSIGQALKVDPNGKVIVNQLETQSDLLTNDNFAIRSKNSLAKLVSFSKEKRADDQVEGYLSTRDVYLADKKQWATDMYSKARSTPKKTDCLNDDQLGKIWYSNKENKLYICDGVNGWKSAQLNSEVAQ